MGGTAKNSRVKVQNEPEKPKFEQNCKKLATNLASLVFNFLQHVTFYSLFKFGFFGRTIWRFAPGFEVNPEY